MTASPLLATGSLPRRFASLAASVAGWRRVLIAVGAGALSVQAMAPFHAWPILCLTLPVLVWLLDGALGSQPYSRAGIGRAFWCGWMFGFGYFVAGLFWVGEAFLVEAEIFAWLIPFAVTLLPAGLAIFWGLAAAVAGAFWREDAGRVVVLALALATTEWLRSHVFTGFPWNLIGYALTAPLELMQWAAYVGVHGLTLIACVLLPMPLVLLGSQCRPAATLRVVSLVAAALAAMFATGHLRLAQATTAPKGAPVVRLVQPSIPQTEKWRPENQRRIFETHLALSLVGPGGGQSGLDGVALVVWPEAAMPFVPLATPEALSAIGDLLPQNTVLASGALRVEALPGRSGASERRVFNSLLLLGAGGLPLAIYDKTHLVPFGEYLPLQGLLEALGLQQLTRLRGGFATGVVPRPVFAVPGLPHLAPLICYEAIFPGTVVPAGQRPAGLLNVTNDGWFGNTTGPRQHFNQARVRAVEEGLPLIRSANNGISALIDGYGRISARIDLNVVGTADAPLPPALVATVYARFGDWIFLAMSIAAGLSLAVQSRIYAARQQTADWPRITRLS